MSVLGLGEVIELRVIMYGYLIALILFSEVNQNKGFVILRFLIYTICVLRG